MGRCIVSTVCRPALLLQGARSEFVEQVALPRLLENPKAVRRDGRDTIDNCQVAGRFFFAGKQWRVHADTHFEPLLLAHSHAPRFGAATAFEQARTSSDLRLDRECA